MFEIFKKRKRENLMEEFINALYGNHPPKAQRANLQDAINLAYNELLMGNVDIGKVQNQADALFRGPIPYSTHELALSVALHFFKQPEYVPHLNEAQMIARLMAVQWHQQQLVVAGVVQAFENTLYKLYKPSI